MAQYNKNDKLYMEKVVENYNKTAIVTNILNKY